MKRRLVIIGIFIAFVNNLNATTWFDTEHICPICKQKGDYKDIGSYGGYIYNWPSKYQYVYWPLTDFPSVYCCLNCHFSSYMWDFDSVPGDKIDTLTRFLSRVKIDKDYRDYIEIPMTTRLEIAESVYKILGRDKEFWCKFYRVIGYHYDQEKNISKAKESRLIALDTARQMLLDTTYSGKEKEIYFIIAAMYNFTEQKDSALLYLDKSNQSSYRNKNWKDENVEGFNEYLTKLITEYKLFIRKKDE